MQLTSSSNSKTTLVLRKTKITKPGPSTSQNMQEWGTTSDTKLQKKSLKCKNHTQNLMIRRTLSLRNQLMCRNCLRTQVLRTKILWKRSIAFKNWIRKSTKDSKVWWIENRSCEKVEIVESWLIFMVFIFSLFFMYFCFVIFVALSNWWNPQQKLALARKKYLLLIELKSFSKYKFKIETRFSWRNFSQVRYSNFLISNKCKTYKHSCKHKNLLENTCYKFKIRSLLLQFWLICSCTLMNLSKSYRYCLLNLWWLCLLRSWTCTKRFHLNGPQVLADICLIQRPTVLQFDRNQPKEFCLLEDWK